MICQCDKSDYEFQGHDSNLNKLLNCDTPRQCNICTAHDVDVFHDDNSQILSLIA